MTSMKPPKLACRRGDVVLVIFPHADLSGAKLRSALVVQADDLGTDLPQLIVAMITARMFRAGHPSRVVVARDPLDFQARQRNHDIVIRVSWHESRPPAR